MRTRWNTSVCSSSIWNLEVLVFKERGKPQYPEKNLSEQGREPTTNSTHIWGRRQDSHLGHIGGRRVLSPLRHPCSRANWTTKPNGSKSWVIKLIFLKGPLMALEAWPKALQSSSRGSSKKGKRDPCMAKKVMLKFATCTKVKQSLYSLSQLILQFSLLRLMLRALSVPSFVSQCYTAQH